MIKNILIIYNVLLVRPHMLILMSILTIPLLGQLKHFFNLIEFKECSKNHKIKTIVDNSPTQSARACNWLDFGKRVSLRCLVENLEWADDNGEAQSLSCYSQDGYNERESKGVYEIAAELRLNLLSRVKLIEFREVLCIHPDISECSIM